MPSVAERFSLLYIEKGAPLPDSARARMRIYGQWSDYVSQSSSGSDFGLPQRIRKELGVSVPATQWGYDWHAFFTKCAVRDFLDTITQIFAVFENHMSRRAEFLAFARRVMEEENMAYRVDNKGVVHYRVDNEHEQNVASAVAALGSARFKAVGDAFQRARDDLAKAQPDTLDALRSLFESAESLFKIVTESNASLDEREVKGKLSAFVDKKMAERDEVAKSASARFTLGFADWVNACHPYRHGHDQPNAPEPPIELAVALMSSGAAYLRWLATLDQV